MGTVHFSHRWVKYWMGIWKCGGGGGGPGVGSENITSFFLEIFRKEGLIFLGGGWPDVW